MGRIPDFVRRGLTGVLVLGAVVAGAAGCGGGDEDGSATDLTKFAPADAPIFVEGSIRPEGDLKDSIESILERFPDGDQVGDELIKSINEGARTEGEDFTYEDDIEPWLGERAAFYATSFKSHAPSADDDSATDLGDGAFIAETTDEDEAREKIRELAQDEGEVTEREYNGVTYELSPDDESPGELAASAVFDGVAVAGSEQGVKDTIDASQGDSLSGNTGYAEFREERGSDLLMSAYADVGALLDAIPSSPEFTAQQRDALKSAYGSFTEQPVMFGAEVTSEGATFDFQGGETPFGSAGASELLEAGFEESWFAAAVPDLGKSFSQSFEQIASAGVPQSQVNQIDSMLQKQLGFSFEDLEGIGDVAVFASGESLVELQVGGIVEVPDAATRDKLLEAISDAAQRSGAGKVTPLSVEGAEEGFSIQVPDLPVPINVAASGDRVAIGAGPAAQALLSGDGGLTGSASYEAASEALGEGSSLAFLVEMDPIVDLVESTGQDDADFQEAKPYLEAFDFFASGIESGDETETQRFVVRLSDSE